MRIAQATSDSGVQLDEQMHTDMVSMVESSSREVESMHPEGSFQRIFWEEQKKAMQCKDRCQVRWHPLIIKWCLYLWHRSSGAYETLQNSGVLKLPSQRTLRDYTHYIQDAYMMDKFFDSVNITSFSAGKRQGKPFQDQHRSASDFRLKVCTPASNLSVHVGMSSDILSTWEWV